MEVSETSIFLCARGTWFAILPVVTLPALVRAATWARLALRSNLGALSLHAYHRLLLKQMSTGVNRNSAFPARSFVNLSLRLVHDEPT